MPALLGALVLVAVLCCGLFAGAAIYINLVGHPARMEGGAALGLTEWRPSYRRAPDPPRPDREARRPVRQPALNLPDE